MSEELKDILADVKQEGTSLEDVLTDTASESPPGTKLEVKEPEEGDNTPDNAKYADFRQHPRWIQREKELDELRARDEQRATELAELSAFRDELYRELETDSGEIPTFFRELYGDNQEAWQAYSAREREREAEITQKVIEAQEERNQQAAVEVEYWNDWVKNQMETLKTEGHVFDENAFGLFMLEVMPTTIDNNLDFEKGMTLYERLNPKDLAASSARKRLGDATTRTTSKESSSRDYMTPEDFVNKTWNQL